MNPSIRSSLWLLLGIFCMVGVNGETTAGEDERSFSELFSSNLPEDSEQRLRQSWTATVFFENDLVSDTDQDYTNGVQLSFVSPDLQWFEDADVLPGWAQSVLGRLPLVDRDDPDLLRSVAINLGQEMYTPDDIERAELILDDRPYAGWLYLGVGLQSRSFRRSDTVELQLGLVGPASLAKQTQNAMHRMQGIPRARGWENQLRAEPAFLLAYDRRLKLSVLRGEGERPMGMDLFGHWGGAGGTLHTYANAGMEIRMGWNPTSDFGASRIGRPGNSNSPASIHDARFEERGFSSLVFFAGIEGRRVFRNLFLDGSTFGSSHSVDKEPWLGEVSAGFSTVFSGYKFAYRQVWRSREFTQQSASHSYGSFTLSYSF